MLCPCEHMRVLIIELDQYGSSITNPTPKRFTISILIFCFSKGLRLGNRFLEWGDKRFGQASLPASNVVSNFIDKNKIYPKNSNKHVTIKEKKCL